MNGYHFKIEKDGKFFIASCVELEGCRTQGKTLDELETSMVEALTLYLDEPVDSKFIFPDPKTGVKTTGELVEVFPDIRVWFSHNLRQLRLKKHLSQREAAEKLGISALSGYQKLEKRANPTIETLAKIKKAFPEFEFELPNALHV